MTGEQVSVMRRQKEGPAFRDLSCDLMHGCRGQRFRSRKLHRKSLQESLLAGAGTIPHALMKLPNSEKAFVDIAKLRDYSLNPEHESGGHKARVFRAALGLKIK